MDDGYNSLGTPALNTTPEALEQKLQRSVIQMINRHSSEFMSRATKTDPMSLASQIKAFQGAFCKFALQLNSWESISATQMTDAAF